ncbi:hypothetical protein bcere0023_1930 [Bacillus cereus Rock4-2]|nr:hypothetical protein bcere0023_1930 [Bacillus cereus Rock4-2]
MGEHLKDKKKRAICSLTTFGKIIPVDIGNDFFYDEIKS